MLELGEKFIRSRLCIGLGRERKNATVEKALVAVLCGAEIRNQHRQTAPEQAGLVGGAQPLTQCELQQARVVNARHGFFEMGKGFHLVLHGQGEVVDERDRAARPAEPLIRHQVRWQTVHDIESAQKVPHASRGGKGHQRVTNNPPRDLPGGVSGGAAIGKRQLRGGPQVLALPGNGRVDVRDAAGERQRGLPVQGRRLRFKLQPVLARRGQGTSVTSEPGHPARGRGFTGKLTGDEQPVLMHDKGIRAPSRRGGDLPAGQPFQLDRLRFTQTQAAADGHQQSVPTGRTLGVELDRQRPRTGSQRRSLKPPDGFVFQKVGNQRRDDFRRHVPRVQTDPTGQVTGEPGPNLVGQPGRVGQRGELAEHPFRVGGGQRPGSNKMPGKRGRFTGFGGDGTAGGGGGNRQRHAKRLDHRHAPDCQTAGSLANRITNGLLCSPAS